MLRLALVASLVCIAPTLAHAAGPGSLSVQILSATTKSKVVGDAQVIFQKDGATSLTATTDAQGKVSIANTLGADDAAIKMIVKKPGYSPLIVTCPCNGMSYAISETLGQQLESFRVVLNWGSAPNDLDLHASYPANHIFFSHKKGSDAFLDVDDTDAYGPETVTVHKRHQREKYVFAIHNYSALDQHGTKSLSNSQAKAFVYVGESLVKSFYVPTNQVGALWVLFGIDETGALHEINNLVDIAEAQNVDRYLRQLTERADFGSPTRAPQSVIAIATRLNGEGEAALQAGQVEQAIDLFERAIVLHPNFGLAYANLSKAQAKLNRTAEAAWNARKAEEIGRQVPSNGYRIPNDKLTLQASSFLQAWRHYTFAPENLIDDNLWSSWQPNRKPNGGVEQWVKLTFQTPQTVTGLAIFNGFRLVDDLGDLYAMNNRIKDATLQFSDGTEMPIHFEDQPIETTITLPTPKSCTWVKMIVKSVYKGSKWNDLAISEFHALGQPE